MSSIDAEKMEDCNDLRLGLVRGSVLVECKGVELVDALAVACTRCPVDFSTHKL